MTPANIKINGIKQGKDHIIKFIYQDSSTNEYINVSGYLVKFHLIDVVDYTEATPISPIVVTYSSDDADSYITLTSNGEIIISLPGSETDNYVKRGKFELEVTTDDATVMNYNLIEGIFEPILKNF